MLAEDHHRERRTNQERVERQVGDLAERVESGAMGYGRDDRPPEDQPAREPRGVQQERAQLGGHEGGDHAGPGGDRQDEGEDEECAHGARDCLEHGERARTSQEAIVRLRRE